MNSLYRIKFRLEFETPFVISSPVSEAGQYDIVTVRDTEGLPFIPPSTIRGRIKASLQEFCSIYNTKFTLCRFHALNSIESDPSSDCPLCRIFGAPGGESIRGFFFSGAHVPEDEKEIITRMEKDIPGTALYKRTRNRIDRQLRRAQEDALFSVGAGQSLLSFEGSVVEEPHHKTSDPALREVDLALIITGMRLITEMGLNKNRGYGRCRFTPLEIAPGGMNWQDVINKYINSHLRHDDLQHKCRGY